MRDLSTSPNGFCFLGDHQDFGEKFVDVQRKAHIDSTELHFIFFLFDNGHGPALE